MCGDIGLVVLSGLKSRRTHPVGVEGATMARRAPFQPSSIPAYIEQSMKLFVCLSAILARDQSFQDDVIKPEVLEGLSIPVLPGISVLYHFRRQLRETKHTINITAGVEIHTSYLLRILYCVLKLYMILNTICYTAMYQIA
jgi:hypothetical protein